MLHGSFWYDEKLVYLIAYVDTHQRGSCLSEICVGVDNICSDKQWKNTKEGLNTFLRSRQWQQEQNPCND